MRFFTPTLALFALAPTALAQDPCEGTTTFAYLARQADLRDDLLTSLARCLNVTDPADAADCRAEAWDEYFEGQDEADEQRDARRDVCALLGGGAYDPEIDPENFRSRIRNPLLPWTPGATWVYEQTTPEGLERIVVEVLDARIEILGVSCTVVRDTVTLDGVLVEDTDDYYAEDRDGNVWYFGEISLNYDDEGRIEDLDGSWRGGVNGAKPGIVMFASPLVGVTYRQEFALAEAEDMGTVVSLNETAVTPFGTFTGCLETSDFTPLEPGARERKFYAPGLGFVLEINPATGERLPLVDFFFQ